MLALVVDDSRMARYVLGKMLQEQGILVDSVESAEEALGYLCGKHPDMIFMDHTMPGMDGIQALRAIKNDPKTTAIPIMMYTSKEGEVYMSQARKAGAAEVLPKQLKPEQLLQVLERQQLLPGENNGTPAANDEDQAPARVITASDLGEDIEQVAKAAEKSIENKTFTNQVRRMLDEHRDELAVQAKERTEDLLSSLEEKLNDVSDKLESFIVETHNAQRGYNQSNGNGIKLMFASLVVLILIGFGLQNAKVTKNLAAIEKENQQLKDAINTEDAKAESDRSLLEDELKDLSYKSQLQTNEWQASLEWALNRSNVFAWDEKPFNDQLAQLIGEVADRLQTAGFAGTILVTSHLGTFCTTTGPDGEPKLPSSDALASECDVQSVSEFDAVQQGMAQTIGFSHFAASFDVQYQDNIKLDLRTSGARIPKKPYPNLDPELAAVEWNRIAGINNRVELELKPAN